MDKHNKSIAFTLIFVVVMTWLICSHYEKMKSMDIEIASVKNFNYSEIPNSSNESVWPWPFNNK